MTDSEPMARMGELLRLRMLLISTHEGQLERIDSRLAALYPPAFLAVVVEAKAQAQEPPHFLT